MLLGRRDETEQLTALLSDARLGCSRVLAIEGDPGVGKSALLDRAAAMAHGFTLLRTTGFESEGEVAFGALLSLCRPLLNLLPRLAAAQAEALQTALGLSVSGRSERFLVGAGLVELFAMASTAHPLLVIIDDLQWVDPPSAQALLFAARRLEAESVGLLVAARSGTTLPVRLDGIERLVLVGIDHDAARELMSTLAADVTESVADRLHASTGGNPLALTELMRTLTPLQRAGRDRLPEPLPAVASLESAYAARIAAFEVATRRALVIAATAGDTNVAAIGPALGRCGCGLVELAPPVDAGLLDLEGGHLRWRHPLVRSVVYHGATSAERRQAHLALAVEMDQRSAAWAWHRAAAATGPDEDAAAALTAVAEQAKSQAGLATAAAAFEHAARLSARPRDVATRLHAAADAAWLAGDPMRATRLLDEALAGCPDGDLRGRILHLRAYTEYTSGDVRRAAQLCLEATELVEAADPSLAAQCLSEAVLAHWWSLDADGMLAAARRLRALAERHPTMAWYADIFEGIALIFAGRREEGVALLNRAESAPDSEDLGVGQPRSIWMLQAPGWLGRHTQGHAIAVERIRELRSSGALAMLPRLLRMRASQDLDDNRWAECVAAATEALELCDELGQTGHHAELFALLATVDAYLGDADACRRHAQESLSAADAHGLAWARPMAQRALGLLALGQGDFTTAIARFDEVVSVPYMRGLRGAPVLSLPDLIEALARLGRHDEAATRTLEFERRINGLPDPLAPALLARCRALIATDGAAEGAYEAAVELASDTSDVIALARTRLLLGEWLRRHGERKRSRAELQRAREVFEAYGAEPWIARVRDELAATGATLRARAMAREQLTPSELRVAVLAADGLSNREIGEQLYLSHKTVECHLGRAYDKLGVRSRTQLARRLAGRVTPPTQTLSA